MNALLVQPAQELLVPALSPAHICFLDLETYWDKNFSLSKLTTASYVRDPRYQTLGIGVKVDDGETLWMEHEEFVEWARTWDWSITAVCSHSPTLEPLVLAEIYGIIPAFYFDTIAIAHALNLPGGLGELAIHFGVGEKGDELERTKGKRREDLSAEDYAYLGLYCVQDVDLMAAIFQKMIASFPEAELWLINLTIRMFSQPQYVLDQAMLQQYMVDERQRKAELLARCGIDKKSVGSNDKLAQAFWDLGVDPPTKISKRTGKEAYAFAKDDVGMLALLEHEIEEVRWLAEARVDVKSTINTSRGARFLELGKDGRRMPVALKYYGAHTGRWSGTESCNFQNLERTNKRDPSKGKLKKSLLAPPGHKVVAVDSGAIEARGVAWLAEHKPMVEAFAQNRDLYSEFASEVYSRKIDRKRNEADEIPGYIGKTCVLGLLYNQGFLSLGENFLKGSKGPVVQFGAQEISTMNINVDAFISDERKLPMVEKVLSRLNLEDRVMHYAVADHLVKKYRATNKPIPALWKFLSQLIKMMAEGVEGKFGPNDCLQTVKNGILLPNGLKLHYPELQEHKRQPTVGEDGEEIEEWRSRGWSYWNGLKRSRIYGGLLLENICQALARIVIGEQMLHAHAVTGYRPSHGTHDEWVFVVPDSEAHQFKDFLIQTMRTAPKWAAGWPLNAEGGVGVNYGDAK